MLIGAFDISSADIASANIASAGTASADVVSFDVAYAQSNDLMYGSVLAQTRTGISSTVHIPNGVDDQVKH